MHVLRVVMRKTIETSFCLVVSRTFPSFYIAQNSGPGSCSLQVQIRISVKNKQGASFTGAFEIKQCTHKTCFIPFFLLPFINHM